MSQSRIYVQPNKVSTLIFELLFSNKSEKFPSENVVLSKRRLQVKIFSKSDLLQLPELYLEL